MHQKDLFTDKYANRDIFKIVINNRLSEYVIMDQREQKKIVGYKAAELIRPGMVVGIGTGSTVFFFIEKLIERVKQGLHIQAVFSSYSSQVQAAKGGILPIQNEFVKQIDLTVDGADEIDNHFTMIKGGGGALVREKILAASSKEMVVIVDSSKHVKQIGKQKLPIEILPFCFNATIHKINELGLTGTLRKKEEGSFFITDNGNYIYDIHLKELIHSPKELHLSLVEIPGVVETGLFFDVATKLLICDEKGRIQERTP